jgi:nucleotide-binding universal stress UspA family protein
MGDLYDHILVATDGSDVMLPVVEHAAKLAREHDATVHALYVIDAAGFTDLPMESSWENLRQMLQEEGQNALDDVERRVGDDVAVEGVIREGSPSAEIVAYAEEAGCDLVVMGTHGRQGLDHFLLGSVAERVVRTAKVPVLTIRVETGELE